mmetsp:Transcript_30960/g.67908  ORF Transcript_30960/g.67908 Transcript_30960/m.67908 type:complete len:110 (-) Transcript_30960:17-346(-)
MPLLSSEALAPAALTSPSAGPSWPSAGDVDPAEAIALHDAAAAAIAIAPSIVSIFGQQRDDCFARKVQLGRLRLEWKGLADSQMAQPKAQHRTSGQHGGADWLGTHISI